MTGPRRKFLILVDDDKREWDMPTITGAQLRVLADVPKGVCIFLSVTKAPDREIYDDTVIDLESHDGPPWFSTQVEGSQGG